MKIKWKVMYPSEAKTAVTLERILLQNAVFVKSSFKRVLPIDIGFSVFFHG